jgi:hypothetical protein
MVGCIYEYPEMRPDSGAVELTVALTLNIEFEMDAGEEQFVQAHEALFAEGYRIRYIVDLYEPPVAEGLPPSQRLRRLTATENAMPPGGTYRFSETVALSAAKYVALVWVDFVRADNPNNDLYYLTGNLLAVTIDNSRPYRGYHVSKDAFTASVSVDLTSAREQNARMEATVEVKRPFAFYRIVADDVAEYRAQHSANYADMRPNTTHLQYQAWFPMGYDAYPSLPDNYDDSGVHYTCNVPATDEPVTEVELAADFVFVGTVTTAHLVDFDIRTPQGARISRHNSLRIDLRRNRLTVIRGAFLTLGNSSGGTGIDFDFDEEIVIQF